jgi:hypothetical protein
MEIKSLEDICRKTYVGRSRDRTGLCKAVNSLKTSVKKVGGEAAAIQQKSLDRLVDVLERRFPYLPERKEIFGGSRRSTGVFHNELEKISEAVSRNPTVGNDDRHILMGIFGRYEFVERFKLELSAFFLEKWTGTVIDTELGQRTP